MEISITDAEHIVKRVSYLLKINYGIKIDEFDDVMIEAISLDIYRRWYLNQHHK